MHMSRIGTFALIATLSGPVAWAQNLVDNPWFHADVNGWYTEAVATVAWSAEDADSSPSSGSALVTNTHPDEANGAGMSQCIATPVVPNAAYSYGGQLLVPSDQGNTGMGQLGLRWYANADCSGQVVGNQPRSSTEIEGSWVTLDSIPQVAPPGAHSVKFLAFVTKWEAGGSRVVHADNLYLVNTDVLFADSFEGGDTEAWSQTIP